MNIELKEIPDFLEEMRKLISSIKVTKGYTERLSVSYVVMVEKEEDKEDVEKVGNLLTEQAAKGYGLDIEIVAATEQELKESAERYKAYQAEKNGSFEL